MNKARQEWGMAVGIGLLLAGLLAVPALAAEQSVTVRPGETLSVLAARYMGDKDAWRELARHNHIANPNRIYPGQVVMIPGTSEEPGPPTTHRSADAAIREAQEKRQRLLALNIPALFPDEFRDADGLLANAIQAKNAGSLPLALQLAELASEALDGLYSSSELLQLQAPLQISDYAGECSYRAPSKKPEPVQMGTPLAEGTEIVTQADGRVTLDFADGSSVVIEEAARVRIARARTTAANEGRYTLEIFSGWTEWKINPTHGEWKVAGPSGEALLLGPEAALGVEGGAFRCSAFVGSIRLTTVTEQTVVPAGYGIMVDATGRLSDVHRLPPPPELRIVGEEQEAIGYVPADAVAGYRLCIRPSAPSAVGSLAVADVFAQGAAMPLPDLPEGEYRVTLASLTEDGLRGPVSDPLIWREDNTRPSLTVDYPADDSVVERGDLTLRGRTEENVRVMVNGNSIRVDARGHFAANLPMAPGLHLIKISATDRRGNVTDMIRRIFVLDGNQHYAERDGVLYTNNEVLPVSLPSAGGQIMVADEAMVTGMVTNIPLEEGRNNLHISHPTIGTVEAVVCRDQTPPVAQRIKVTTLPLRSNEALMRVMLYAEDEGVGLAEQATIRLYSSSDRNYDMMLEYDAAQGAYIGETEVNVIDLYGAIYCTYFNIRDRLQNFVEGNEVAHPYEERGPLLPPVR